MNLRILFIFVNWLFFKGVFFRVFIYYYFIIIIIIIYFFIIIIIIIIIIFFFFGGGLIPSCWLFSGPLPFSSFN